MTTDNRLEDELREAVRLLRAALACGAHSDTADNLIVETMEYLARFDADGRLKVPAHG